MSGSHPTTALSAEHWDWIDGQVKSFEQQWSPERFQQLDDFLAAAGPARRMLLLELIHSDLELQFRHGRSISIEHYVEKAPELLENSSAIAELIWLEFKLRQQTQPELTLQGMLAHLPELQKYVGTPTRGTDYRATLPLALPGELALSGELGDQYRPTIPGYEFQALLGRGGMGVVYRALDTQLNREVAIKLMRSGMLASQAEFARFQNEARTVAALQHPQVLQLYHIGQYMGQPFLVLEFAAGGSLAKHLAGKPYADRPAAELLRGLALATEAIHRCNIIHRDLKPANILLTKDNIAKIADFGLAKHMAMDLSKTKDDLAWGTPSYASPESLLGGENRNRPTTDVYSLGAILYELLTGRPPFVGSSVLDIIRQSQSGELLSPAQLVPGIAADLTNICLKCLDRNPDRRYATAQELADDLGRFLEGRSVHARPVSRLTRIHRWALHNPSTSLLIATVALFLLVVTSGAITFGLWQAHVSSVEEELRSMASIARENALANEARALTEASAANESIEFLERTFDSAVLGQSLDSTVPVPVSRNVINISGRDVVQRSIEQLEKSLIDHPLARARLLTSIGTSALNIGMVREAHQLLTEALQLYANAEQMQSLSAATALVTMARINVNQCRFSLSHDQFDEAFRIFHDLNAEDNLLWANACVFQTEAAITARSIPWIAETQHEIGRAVDIRARILGRDHPLTILAASTSAIALAAVDHDIAALLGRMTDEWNRMKHSPANPYYKALLLDDLASFHQRHGDSVQAKEFIALALQFIEQAIGEMDHPAALEILSDNAWIAHCSGNERLSAQYQTRAVEMRLRIFGFDYETLNLIGELITRLSAVGEYRQREHWIGRLADYLPTQLTNHTAMGVDAQIDKLQNEGSYAEAALLIDFWRNNSDLGDDWFDSKARWSARHAELSILSGDYPAALAQWSSFQKETASSNRPIPESLKRLWMQVPWLCGRLDPDEAAAFEAVEVELPEDDDVPQFHQDDWARIVTIIQAMGNNTLHVKQLEKWSAGWLGQKFPQHVCQAALQQALAHQSMLRRDDQTALSLFNKSIETYTESLGPNAPHTLDAQLELAQLQIKRDQVSAGIATARRVSDLADQACGPSHPNAVRYRLRFLEILLLADDAVQAEQLARSTLNEVRVKLGIHHELYCRCLELLHKSLIKQHGSKFASDQLRPMVGAMQQAMPDRNPFRLRAEILSPN